MYIESRAKVDVALIEHHQKGDPSGVHMAIVQSTWNPTLGTASGFSVDPNGSIVTTGAITNPDLQRAWVFAVNQAFHQRYGTPLPADPFAKQVIGNSTDRLQERLTACYPPNVTNDAGGCVVRVTPDLVVYPYVTSQQKYGTLHAEVLPGSTREVAVLGVRGANSMPTVGLGQSTAGAEAIGVLGFTGIPSMTHMLTQISAHLAAVGATTLKTAGLKPDEAADNAAVAKGLGQGMSGGPVVAERGQVIGFLTPATPADGTSPGHLVGMQAILAALKTAGVTPHGGPVDASFETAMHSFKNQGYAASIPGFTQALQFFPGHLLATQNLAVAKQKAGTAPAPSGAAAGSTTTQPTSSTTGSQSLWLWIVVGVLLLLAAAGGGWLLLRRRRAGGPPESPGEATAATPQPVRASQAPGSRPSQARVSGPSAAPTSRPGQAPASRPSQTPSQAPASRPSQAPASRPSQAPARPGPPAAAPRSPAVGVDGRPVSGAPAPAARRPGAPAPDAAARGAAGPNDPAPVPAPRAARSAVPSAAAAPSAPAAPAASAAASTSSPSSARFCTSCGARLGDNHRFCGSCGTPVS